MLEANDTQYTPRIEQCYECRYWYPIEEMVWYPEVEQFVCQGCPVPYFW
jgi:hypothetical protein